MMMRPLAQMTEVQEYKIKKERSGSDPVPDPCRVLPVNIQDATDMGILVAVAR